MRRAFTTDRLLISEQMLAGLPKVNHQQLEFVEADFNQTIYSVYSLNEIVLFLYMLLIKARLEIILIILKIVSSPLSSKYGNKEGQTVQRV